MRISWICVVLTALVLPTACSFSFTNRESVKIPGDADPDAKLEIAKAVATEIWESGLIEATKQRFPELSDSELRSIGVRWNTFTTKPLTGEDRQTKVTVSIQCVFQHKRSFEYGKRVVNFCKEAVEKGLKAHLARAAAA